MHIVRDDNFMDQVKAVIDDAPANFQSFWQDGGEITDTTGNYFKSNQTIEGTNDNGILRAADGWMYQANIIYSAPMSEAKKICDEWSRKLDPLKGMGFEKEATLLTPAVPHGIYGCKFLREDITVVLELWPLAGDDGSGTLNLGFFNWR